MPPPYDIAIILGAALADDGRPRPALVRRVEHGVALQRRGEVPRLLMSGGLVRGPVPEARVMRELALACGLGADCVLTEDASRDTVDNVRHSLALAQRHGWRRLLVVSDAYHLPRALWIFRRYGAAAEGSAPDLPPGLPRWPIRLREACAFPLTVWKAARRPPLA